MLSTIHSWPNSRGVGLRARAQNSLSGRKNEKRPHSTEHSTTVALKVLLVYVGQAVFPWLSAAPSTSPPQLSRAVEPGWRSFLAPCPHAQDKRHHSTATCHTHLLLYPIPVLVQVLLNLVQPVSRSWPWHACIYRMYVGACVCGWVNACVGGCLCGWINVGVCGWMWVDVGGCGCVWVPGCVCGWMTMRE